MDEPVIDNGGHANPPIGYLSDFKGGAVSVFDQAGISKAIAMVMGVPPFVPNLQQPGIEQTGGSAVDGSKTFTTLSTDAINAALASEYATQAQVWATQLEILKLQVSTFPKEQK